MITPKNENFEFNPDASLKNGWTMEKLLDLPENQRPTLDQVWKNFMTWGNETRESQDKPVIFCAYNGY